MGTALGPGPRSRQVTANNWVTLRSTAALQKQQWTLDSAPKLKWLAGDRAGCNARRPSLERPLSGVVGGRMADPTPPGDLSLKILPGQRSIYSKSRAGALGGRHY